MHPRGSCLCGVGCSVRWSQMCLRFMLVLREDRLFVVAPALQQRKVWGAGRCGFDCLFCHLPAVCLEQIPNLPLLFDSQQVNCPPKASLYVLQKYGEISPYLRALVSGLCDHGGAREMAVSMTSLHFRQIWFVCFIKNKILVRSWINYFSLFKMNRKAESVMIWCLDQLIWFSRILWLDNAWSCAGFENRSPIQVMADSRHPSSPFGPWAHETPQSCLQCSWRWLGHCGNLNVIQGERNPCCGSSSCLRQPPPPASYGEGPTRTSDCSAFLCVPS